ncbi:hypothetical protein ONZ45_g8837 [Pleurotus djamor]|nr:hypothetical protein ONZ45_g8837 [Pleurotus djamor]
MAIPDNTEATGKHVPAILATQIHRAEGLRSDEHNWEETYLKGYREATLRDAPLHQAAQLRKVAADKRQHPVAESKKQLPNHGNN